MNQAHALLTVEAPEALTDPARNFNGDEFGVPLHQTSNRVIVAKGTKQVYQKTSNTKEQITVYACGNVTGAFLPPKILFPGQRLRNIGMGDYPEAHYSCTDKGWMDSETFVTCLEALDEFATQQNIKRPIILYIDGHKTHCTFEAAQFCNTHDIILYCLLPHASHITQPLDVGVFSSLQDDLGKAIIQFQVENPNLVPTKYNFPKIFKQVWETNNKSLNLVKGFKASGIYPLNGEILVDRIILKNNEIPHSEGTSSFTEEEPAQDVITTTAQDVITTTAASSSVEPQPGPSTPCSNVNVHVPGPSGDSAISPAFEELLKVPVVAVPTKRENKLPRHMSGTRAIAYFEAKRKEKEEIEKGKEERKRIREERKREKEEKEKEKKTRKTQKGKRKGKRAPLLVNQRSKKQKLVYLYKTDGSSSSDQQIPYMDSSDEELYQNIDREHCPKCGLGDVEDEGETGKVVQTQ